MNITIPLPSAALLFLPTVNISKNLFFPDTLAFSSSSRALISVEEAACQYGEQSAKNKGKKLKCERTNGRDLEQLEA